MLPLTHKDHRSLFYRVKTKLNDWKRLIFADRNSRNLFLFLLLNLSFAFVELFYGIATNSLGLISDSFHMFFDCTGLLAGLAASVITKWKANDKYSFGYVRAEVLAGFVNSLFLLFIAFFILSEGVERAIEPPEVKHERLFVVSVLGFLVNLIGIYAFQHGHGHSHGGGGGHGHSHGHSHDDHEHLLMNNFNHGHSHDHGSDMHGHSHDHNHMNHHHHDHQDHSIELQIEKQQLTSGNSQIMRGVFLHILADTLGSVGVIISAVLMHLFGWMRADPICSIFIALLIALSVIGLIRESIAVLMQRQPPAIDHLLAQCYNRVLGLAGVCDYYEPHFWTLCSDVYIGTIKLKVAKNCDHQYITKQTRMIFESIGIKQITIQLDFV